jgi:hypothetical protein
MANPPFWSASDGSKTLGCFLLILCLPSALAVTLRIDKPLPNLAYWVCGFATTLGILILCGRDFGVLRILAECSRWRRLRTNSIRRSTPPPGRAPRPPSRRKRALTPHEPPLDPRWVS